MTAQVITCEVLYIPLQLSFDLLFVYGFNTEEERTDLWESLVGNHITCQKPWMILGDFNSLLTPEARICSNPVSWSEVVDFIIALRSVNLLSYHT